MPRILVPALRAIAAVALVLAACAPRAPLSAPPMYEKRAESARGMVTASQPQAAAAGAAMLRAGGNAIDAAVATAFALGVVDPSQTGLGAGGTMVVWHHDTHRADALDFYPRTGADPDWARVDTAAVRRPVNGRLAAIPGAVAGLLEAHAKWGKLTRAQVLAPAIALARDGFPVSPLLSRTSESAKAKLAADPAAAALFLPGGVAVRPGDLLVQARLAETLEAIARDGRAAFYEGALAERTVEKMRSLGSPVTVADFNGYPVTDKRPLCTPWMGYTLLSAAPPMGGTTTLEALNLLAASHAEQLGSPTTEGAAAVRMAGAIRVASTDAGRYRGDPTFFAVPARGVASPAFAAARAGEAGTVEGGAAIEPGDPWAADAAAPSGACAALDAWGASALPRD
ncbi:MAG: gamma-glutamyltransferase, partial [Gemmatimonadaceae bacterium]